MKGFNYRFLTLILFIIGKVISVSAYDIDNDGLYYDILPYNSNNEGYELCVTGYDKQRTVSFYATIPDELFIDGIIYKVTEIASFAFSDDDMWLEGVTIGKNVKKIGSFRNLGALHYLSVDSENAIFDSRNNCNAIIETETNTLIVGCSKTIIPNTVSTIATGAFQGCGTWISNYFETIVIPSSVTSIGYGCFAGCDNLRSILVDSNNSVYDSRNNCNAIIETNTNTLIAGCNNTVFS